MAMQEKSMAAVMNARIIGSGDETVILAHGYGGDQSVWDKILDRLAQSCRVVVFDWTFSLAVHDPDAFDPLRYSSFHGFVDDLVKLLDELDLKSSVFVGHSMSGIIGCIASVQRPDLFKRLVLVAASPRYINTDDYEGGFKESEVEQIFKAIESSFDAGATQFPTVVVDGKDRLAVEAFLESTRRMRPAAALVVAKTVFLSDERDLLAKVSTPCTIVQPSNDAAVPISVGYYMQKKIPTESTVEIIDCDGHFPQLTAHLKFLDMFGRVLGLDLGV